MMIEQGWQCPICKRIYNPRQEMCLYCGGNNTSSQSTSPEKKYRQGGEISWDTINGYCDTLSTATMSNAINTDRWTTVASSCEKVISADKLTNNTVEINGVELSSMIENSVKGKLNETTVRTDK